MIQMNQMENNMQMNLVEKMTPENESCGKWYVKNESDGKSDENES